MRKQEQILSLLEDHGCEPRLSFLDGLILISEVLKTKFVFSAAEHDIIYLNVNMDSLNLFTDEQIRLLGTCMHFDTDLNCLAKYI